MITAAVQMSVLPPVCEVMQMTVTVEEMKSYLRVDFEDDDALIENFISAARCSDRKLHIGGEEAVHGYPADGR